MLLYYITTKNIFQYVFRHKIYVFRSGDFMYTETKIKKPLTLHSFYTAFEETHSPGFSFDGESHNFWEFVYVADGKLGVLADEKLYMLSKNEIIFHKPMEFHRIWSEGDTPLKIFIISFSASGKIMRDFEKAVFQLSFEQQANLAKLMEIFKANCYGIGEKNPYTINLSPEEIQKASAYMELFLLSVHNNNTPLGDITNTDMAIYKNAVKVMEEGVCDCLSVSDIAEMCYVSETKLKKIFSKYTGTGIHKFFLRLKINHASNLLKQGYTVSETAEAAGFCSQAYFSMAFKRETGLSPSEHRKNHCIFPEKTV